jgi:hypothetical protein
MNMGRTKVGRMAAVVVVAGTLALGMGPGASLAHSSQLLPANRGLPRTFGRSQVASDNYMLAVHGHGVLPAAAAVTLPAVPPRVEPNWFCVISWVQGPAHVAALPTSHVQPNFWIYCHS